MPGFEHLPEWLVLILFGLSCFVLGAALVWLLVIVGWNHVTRGWK